MKKIRFYALAMALVLSGLAAAGLGWYIKTYIYLPLELHPEADAIESLFLFPETARAMDLTLEPVERRGAEKPAARAAARNLEHLDKARPREVAQEPTREPTLPPEPAPVYGEDESYFDDALFIGDSRTVGLRDMARLGEADYFCKVGMTIYTVFREAASDRDFGYCRLETLLTEKEYGKIYICLGLNEAGYGISSIQSKYASVLEQIRELQPEAKLIVHSVMTVSRAKAASSWSFRIERIQEINDMLAEFADDETVFYIDINQYIADEEGYLPTEYSADGCHLYGRYYDLWAEYLCQSAILF